MKKSVLLVVLLVSISVVLAQDIPIPDDSQLSRDHFDVEIDEPVGEAGEILRGNDGQCLSAAVLAQKSAACEGRGGTVKIIQGACDDVECSLEQSFFSARPECPDVQGIVKECRSLGFRAVMKKNRGCLYAKCATPDYKEGDLCAENDQKFKRSLVNKCVSDGGIPITGFEEDTGCPKTTCSFTEADTRKACDREVPNAAYKQCDSEGGELVVKYDDLQCVSFQKCVKRGNEDDVEVSEEEVENVGELDVTDLLSVTLKLEGLSTILDSLATKADGIAAYHGNAGDVAKEQRFDRASGMFAAAQERIDSVKRAIADAAADKIVSEEEILAIKHDIKYIKEVVLNNILFVMLGTEPLLKDETPSNEFVDCGTDEHCFDERFRICALTIFNPEDSIEVRLKGLSGKNCVLEAEGETPFGSADMKCAYPDFAFGLERPQDLIPYCKGSMVKMLEDEINGDYEDDFHDEGMPDICIEKEVFEPRDCFTLVTGKFGLPPFCKGLSISECFEEHIADKVGRDEPPECKEAGKSGFECGMFMMDKFGLPRQCEERGYDKKECMIRIMKNEINPEEGGMPPECEGLSPMECREKFSDRGLGHDFEQDDCRGNGGSEECQMRRMDGDRFGPGDRRIDSRPGGIDVFARCKEAGIDSLDECQSFISKNKGVQPISRGCMGSCMQERCNSYDCGEYVQVCEEKCGIPSFENRQEGNRQREMQCAATCEAEGKPWTMSGGKCQCMENQYEPRDRFDKRSEGNEPGRRDLDRKSIESKIESLQKHYQELLNDPSIPDSQKVRLKEDMRREIEQIKGGLGSPDRAQCPNVDFQKRKCIDNGGRAEHGTDGRGCSYVHCQFNSCQPLNQQQKPQCQNVKVQRDGQGCEYYFCESNQCPKVTEPQCDGNVRKEHDGQGCVRYSCEGSYEEDDTGHEYDGRDGSDQGPDNFQRYEGQRDESGGYQESRQYESNDGSVQYGEPYKRDESRENQESRQYESYDGSTQNKDSGQRDESVQHDDSEKYDEPGHDDQNEEHQSGTADSSGMGEVTGGAFRSIAGWFIKRWK